MKTTLLFISILLTSSLFGQIVFVDNFDGVYLYGSANENWYFDINGDGEDDIRFTQQGNQPFNFFAGVTSTLGENKVQVNNSVDEFSIDCSNDTINAFTSFWNYVSFLWNPDSQFDIGVGNHKQAIRVVATNPANGQAGFLYGYIDYTMLETRDLIIHGWYYESSFNQEIIVGEEPSIGITELTTSNNLIQILDMMGRETSFKPNTPLIYVYDDGTTEKVFSVDY
tara:strand:- start:199 stop:873 length:675 start_codon:yes stop_codon:yes gene_type:complete